MNRPDTLYELTGDIKDVNVMLVNRAELDALQADAERLNWLQKAADARKVELAQSIYKVGYEIGEWPSMRVTVKSGTLRDAIDAARGAE